MGKFFRSNIIWILRLVGAALAAFIIWHAASGVFFFVSSAAGLRNPGLIKAADIATFDLAGAEKIVKERGR